MYVCMYVYLADVHPRVLLAGQEEARRHLLLLRQSLHVHHVVQGLLSLSLRDETGERKRTQKNTERSQKKKKQKRKRTHTRPAAQRSGCPADHAWEGGGGGGEMTKEVEFALC